MDPAIFISYRRKDTDGHAGRLFDRFQYWFDANAVYFDVETVDSGDALPEHIGNSLRSAKAVLVVIGPDWLGRTRSPILRVSAPPTT